MYTHRPPSPFALVPFGSFERKEKEGGKGCDLSGHVKMSIPSFTQWHTFTSHGSGYRFLSFFLFSLPPSFLPSFSLPVCYNCFIQRHFGPKSVAQQYCASVARKGPWVQFSLMIFLKTSTQPKILLTLRGITGTPEM